MGSIESESEVVGEHRSTDRQQGWWRDEEKGSIGGDGDGEFEWRQRRDKEKGFLRRRWLEDIGVEFGDGGGGDMREGIGRR